MFSPATTNTPAASIRTSRRRQRPLSNEGSIAQPKAKRHRSTLTDETFIRPDDQASEMTEAKASKPAALVKQDRLKEVTGPVKEIAVRGKKQRSGDRIIKAEGHTILTENDTYTVSQVSAVPDGLLASTTSRQHGAIYSDSGYALTLTHTHATVWLYYKSSSPPPSYTFEIPNPSKRPSEPLPLASLVSPPASSPEPGLVVVGATSGKITYWESVTSAATMGLRLQRNGVELSVPGMHSGETVIQILNAETAGFILAFNSGRIAYMNVRDGQGRPAINVQFLRGNSGSAGSGILSSLRNVLSTSALRGDIAAVRADRPKEVGERNIVVATAKGKIQSWDIQRGGHASLNAEIECREMIVEEIKRANPQFSELFIESFELFDFAYMPNHASQVVRQGVKGVSLQLLASLTDRSISHYFLVEVALLGETIDVTTIRPIRTYETPVNRDATSKPRLYVPSASVSYVVFDHAVVVASLVPQQTSSGSPQPFEDVFHFRKGVGIEIVGSGMEEPQSSSHGIETFKPHTRGPIYPAAVLLVRGVGIVRVAVTDVDRLASSHSQQVTAKSKLEQAVFFAGVEKTPIDFALRPEMRFSPNQLGEATLELSSDILASQAKPIPKLTAKVSDNLVKRSVALRDLAQYLRSNNVYLTRVTRWQLLQDAEKMASAKTVWKKYDAVISAKPDGQKRGLVTDIVEGIHEDYKTEPVPEQGELDRVRQWFMKDISRLDYAIPWAFQVIKHGWQDGVKDTDVVMEMLGEANDVFMGVLETAFKFREANFKLYGLQAELLKHGILEANYEGLPEFWTSTHLVVEAVRSQIELSHTMITAYWNHPRERNLPSGLMDKVRHEHSSLIDIAIRSNNERIRYCLAQAQDSPQFQIAADELKAKQEDAQDAQIIALARDFAMPDEAIALAEKHEILKTLAFVTMLELSDCMSKSASRRDPDDIGSRTIALERQVNHFFEKFGARWATAFYDLQITSGQMVILLDGFKSQNAYLTAFLRGRPEYAKISWIHEIIREADFDEAARALLDLGLKREQDVWSKKIELSIGKLARLTGKSYSQENGILIPDGGKTELATAEGQLGLIKIQDLVYEYILPSIGEALDEKAELQLALEAYGYKGLKKQPTFSSFLEQRMADLIDHKSLDALALVDLLTLMDDNSPESQSTFRYQQFYQALQATRYGLEDDEERILVQRVIWRRCMLRDDWTEINETYEQDDEQRAEKLRGTALYQTFRACLKNHLFDNNDTTVTPITPNEIAGACTDELDHRFTGLDESLQDTILKDFQVEDEFFVVYLKKCRLDEWHLGALHRAKEDYAEEIAGETEGRNSMLEAQYELEDLEKDIERKEEEKANALLRAKPRYRPKARTSGGGGSLRGATKHF